MLETFVSDNNLVIKFNGSGYDYSDHIRINVAGPAVNKLALSTAGSIYCTNALAAPSLTLIVKGAGNLSLQAVETAHLEVLNEGSGTVSATAGSATTAQVRSKGSGKIELGAVAASTVTAKTSGSGSIRVRPAEQLNATVEGSGSIYFTGNPYVSSHISGTGHLIHY